MFDDLRAQHTRLAHTRITDLFDADPERATTFRAQSGDMVFDYSKTTIDSAARAALIALCETAGLAGKRAAMFARALRSR